MREAPYVSLPLTEEQATLLSRLLYTHQHVADVFYAEEMRTDAIFFLNGLRTQCIKAGLADPYPGLPLCPGMGE